MNDALSFAKEAAAPYAKQGFTIREDAWGGDLGVKDQQAVTAQLFKGNEYWFWLATDTRGAVITVHVYDSDGKLAESEFWQKGRFAAAKDHSSQDRRLLRHCHRGKIASRALELGARLWLQIIWKRSLWSSRMPVPSRHSTVGTTSFCANWRRRSTCASPLAMAGCASREARMASSRARKVFEQLNEARKARRRHPEAGV